MWRGCGPRTLWLVLALAGTLAYAEDPHPPAAPDPDPGFLEFLGSVDRMAEVNPDYLSQGQPPAAREQPVKPPAPPPRPPPPPPTAAGDKSND